MAFVSNLDDEEQKNPAQGVVAPIGGASVHLAPSSGVGAAGNGGGASNAPSAGGNFATLQTYLDANQGQAPGLANSITKGIGDQYNSLQGANTSTLQGIQGQVDKGYTPENIGVLSAEAANPVSFASDPNNVTSFQGQLNDKYTGPTSAEGNGAFQNQWANVNNAISTGQGNVGTEAGREGLLQGIEKTPTAGVTALNSAILSQDPSAQNKIETAYQPFSQLTDQLSSGAQGIDANIGKAKAQVTDANSKANAQIASQSQALNTNVSNELNANQAKYQTYQDTANKLGSTLQSGDLAHVPGIDPGLQDFISSNINPWISQNAPGQTPAYNYSNAIPQLPAVAAPTISTSATPQDVAMYGALNTLSGSDIASPLNGLTLGTPFAAPSMPSVDNKAIAGDIFNGLSSVQGKVSGDPYQKYLGLLAALNKYQGLPNTGGPFGPGWSGSSPTIA